MAISPDLQTVGVQGDCYKVFIHQIGHMQLGVLNFRVLIQRLNQAIQQVPQDNVKKIRALSFLSWRQILAQGELQ